MFYGIIQTRERASTSAAPLARPGLISRLGEEQSDSQTSRTVESRFGLGGGGVGGGGGSEQNRCARLPRTNMTHLVLLRQPPRKFPHVSLGRSTCAGDLLLSSLR